MFKNTIRTDQKTDLNAKQIPKLSYASLNERDKKWINSEARSGREKYAGKSLDDITNMVYGKIYKEINK